MSESADARPRQRFVGGVAPSYGQIVLQEGDGSQASGTRESTHGMLAVRTDRVAVAVAHDPATVSTSIEMWDTAPAVEPLDEWDAASEAEIGYSSSLSILIAMYAAPPEVRAELDNFALPAGEYAIRAYGRDPGRHAVAKTDDELLDDEFGPGESGFDPNKYPEEILLQFWPSTPGQISPSTLKPDPRYAAS